MRQGLIFSGLMSLFCLMFFWAGYVNGKRDADRYYAEHPVTLIQPLKLRAPEPVASLEPK